MMIHTDSIHTNLQVQFQPKPLHGILCNFVNLKSWQVLKKNEVEGFPILL